MNIQAIKSALGLSALMLVRQINAETAEPTPWVSHWDNDRRVRVTMHEDVLNQIKQNPDRLDLAYKTQPVTSEGKQPYTRYVVIIPANVEATF
jgi:hypothetical protein